MLGLKFAPEGRPIEVLLLGAHPDDIEIGCGGTLLDLLARQPGASVRWVVFSGDARRHAEARHSAAEYLSSASERRIELYGFRDGYFPYEGAAIKDCFEALKREYQPSVIFTHWTGDAHQDHRVVSELTFNTFRNHLILEYEIPKTDGDFGNPQVFIQLSEEHLARKIALAHKHFPSQADKRWFTPETFTSLARLRGLACNSSSGYAEGFYCRKSVLDLSGG